MDCRRLFRQTPGQIGRLAADRRHAAQTIGRSDGKRPTRLNELPDRAANAWSIADVIRQPGICPRDHISDIETSRHFPHARGQGVAILNLPLSARVIRLASSRGKSGACHRRELVEDLGGPGTDIANVWGHPDRLEIAALAELDDLAAEILNRQGGSVPSSWAVSRVSDGRSDRPAAPRRLVRRTEVVLNHISGPKRGIRECANLTIGRSRSAVLSMHGRSTWPEVVRK